MSIKTGLTKVSVLSSVTIFVLSAVTMLLVSFGAAQADNFGAIAYSKAAGTHGYSYNYATQSAAENSAMQECERYSGKGDCQVIVWFKNGCGALAEGDNGHYGSGWGDTQDLAERNALESCSQATTNCRITRRVCTN